MSKTRIMTRTVWTEEFFRQIIKRGLGMDVVRAMDPPYPAIWIEQMYEELRNE